MESCNTKEKQFGSSTQYQSLRPYGERETDWERERTGSPRVSGEVGGLLIPRYNTLVHNYSLSEGLVSFP